MNTQHMKNFEDMAIRIVTQHGTEITGELIAVADAVAGDPIGAHAAAIVRTTNGDTFMVSVASVVTVSRLDGEPIALDGAEIIGTCGDCEAGLTLGSDRMTLFDPYGRMLCPVSHAVHSPKRR